MTLRTSEGFVWMRILGLVSLFMLVLTGLPLLLSKNADATFLIPSLIGVVIGIIGSVKAVVKVEFLQGKRIRAWRPFRRGESFEGAYGEKLKIELTEKQPFYSYFYLPLMKIEIPDEFYVEKMYHFFGAKNRALAEFQKVQQAAFGEIRQAEFPKPVVDTNSDEWRPKTWEGLLALLGLPVEINEEDAKEKPWLTWSIAALTIAISIYAWIARG
ncbi:MAG: hypothetical protein ABL958_03390, partial [Bdellovibrionia bacterium]